jgi:hypothetical protein
MTYKLNLDQSNITISVLDGLLKEEKVDLINVSHEDICLIRAALDFYGQQAQDMDGLREEVNLLKISILEMIECVQKLKTIQNNSLGGIVSSYASTSPLNKPIGSQPAFGYYQPHTHTT